MPSSGIRTPTTLSQLEHQHKRYQQFRHFASVDSHPSQQRYNKIYAAAKFLLAERNLWRERYNQLFSSCDHRSQPHSTKKRLADAGQVLTAEYLDELDRQMALDGEDSMADDEATISDAEDEDDLLPDLVMPFGHNAEEVARQTATTRLRRGLRRFKVFDHPRPVGRKGRIMQS
jgi:hypothetical protein